MAMIRTVRKNSGVETTLKLLALLTDDVDLVRGKVLISEFIEAGVVATKLSLFILEDNFSYIGARNVWIHDRPKAICVNYADAADAPEFLKTLHKEQDWDKAFPPSHSYHYSLDNLNAASYGIRNYLLLGALPSIIIPESFKQSLDNVLKKIEFDVLATFDPYLLYPPNPKP